MVILKKNKKKQNSKYKLKRAQQNTLQSKDKGMLKNKHKNLKYKSKKTP